MSGPFAGSRIILNFVWKVRLMLRKNGEGLGKESVLLWEKAKKLWDEGIRLRKERDKFTVDGKLQLTTANLLLAEGDFLAAKSNMKQAKMIAIWERADKLWLKAVVKVYGHVEVDWNNFDAEKNDYEFHVKDEIFKP